MTLGMDQTTLGQATIPGHTTQNYARQRISAFPIEIREQDNLSIHSIDDRTSIPDHTTPTPQPPPSEPEPPEPPEPLEPPDPLEPTGALE